MNITAEKFKVATGDEPKQDDLERCNCEHPGRPGHSQCGWCVKHNKPIFMCGCESNPLNTGKPC